LYSEATIIWIFIIKSNDIVKKIGQYWQNSSFHVTFWHGLEEIFSYSF
jgi:hypothetical protein